MWVKKTAGRFATIYRRLPIRVSPPSAIYYHDLVEKGCGAGCQKVELEKFERQMNFLKKNEYNSISIDELEKDINPKSVLICFDDGFSSVYHNAFPILKKYNLKAVVFLTTGFIGGPSREYLDWNMIECLKDSGLFSFGAHTSNHIDVRFVTHKNFYQEIIYPKIEIQKRLGMEVDSFCFPFGKYNMDIIKALYWQKAYKFLFTSDFCPLRRRYSYIQIIGRAAISNDDTIQTFRYKLDGNYSFLYPYNNTRLVWQNFFIKKKERALSWEKY